MTTYMRHGRRALLGVVALATVAGPARGQGIAERVAAVQNGYAEMRFAARDGICGDGRNFIRIGPNTFYGTMNDGWSRREERCRPGLVRVVMRVTSGTVGDVRTYVGDAASDRGDVADLGVVPARDAAAWLLQLARRGESRGEKALLGAVLADSAVVWPGLVAIARDAGTSSKTRREAMHWLSRFASARQSGAPANALWSDKDDDAETPEIEAKKSAVFALSQLRGNAAVESLLQVARTNKEPEVRGSAMFWLSQTDDRRAVDLFEEILKK